MGRHGADVYRFVCAQAIGHQDAEDIYQETFLTLFRSDAVFEDDDHLKKWLLKTASNHCRHLYRWKRRKGTFLLDPKETDWEEAGKMVSVSDNDAYFDPSSDVWGYVTSLKRDQREVIFLFYVLCYSVEEISDITGAGPGAIRMRLHRARRELEKSMKGGVDGLR